MGDPAGIGPEIVARLFADADVRERARPFVVGDAITLERAQATVGIGTPVRRIAAAAEARADGPGIDVLQVGRLPDDLPLGRVDARAGAASYSYVERAIELGLSAYIGAIVTAPINKEALALAGAPHPDHTEALAALTGTRDYAMMLAADDFRVVLASTHVSLHDAVTSLSVDRELSVIRLVDRELRRLGIPEPRIAVAGVNPHAGEHGLFGDEEQHLIAPAIERAAGDGIDVSGPWPGDTIFRRAYAGEFDAVVAQYHDQGLIPLKMVGFERGVNVTLGLPFVRTSVDHGTAFDIAGTGRASHESLRAALDLACRLAAARDGDRAT
jgi:4-hydroxythreonine-4-phosphate dehydrogenase